MALRYRLQRKLEALKAKPYWYRDEFEIETVEYRVEKQEVQIARHRQRALAGGITATEFDRMVADIEAEAKEDHERKETIARERNRR